MEEITTPQERLELWNNAQRAQYVIYTFWGVMGISLLAIASDYFEIALLQDAVDGKGITTELAENSDNRQRVIAIIQMATIIVSAVFFLNWFRRAYGNLTRVNIATDHTERAAAWSFFIPILSIFRPPLIMHEIWQGTQAKIKQLNSSYVTNTKSFIIGIWWLLFVVSHIIGKYAIKATFKDNQTLEGILNTSMANCALDILHVIEAAMVIIIVHNITDMETQLATEVEKAGGTIIP